MLKLSNDTFAQLNPIDWNLKKKKGQKGQEHACMHFLFTQHTHMYLSQAHIHILQKQDLQQMCFFYIYLLDII